MGEGLGNVHAINDPGPFSAPFSARPLDETLVEGVAGGRGRCRTLDVPYATIRFRGWTRHPDKFGTGTQGARDRNLRPPW